MIGKVLSPELRRAYKKYNLFELKLLYGVDSLDLESRPSVTQETVELLQELRCSIENCRRYRIFPFAKQSGDPPIVLAAMVDPDDLLAQDELQRILRFGGLDLKRLAITQEDFDQLIEQYYTIRGQIDQTYQDDQRKKEREKAVEQLSDLTDILESIKGGLCDSPKEGADSPLDSNDANKVLIISLVNRILAKAIQEGASEIHLEPQKNYLNIRFRLDGVLHRAFEPLPRGITSAVVNRLKIMADLDISQNQLPQTGRFRRVYQGRTVDFITDITVSPNGEQVVLQVFTHLQLGIDQLISQEKERNLVRQLMGRSSGLLMAIGPDEAFISNFVDNILAELNTPDKNVASVRLHLTNIIDGVLMMSPQPPETNYLNLLKSCRDQSCDIVLVDQIRDQETAQVVVELALSGHLMLTTLSSPSFDHSLAKLTEMGMTAANLSEVLIGIIHQRNLRKLCPQCRFTAHYTDGQLANFGLSNQSQPLTFYKAKVFSLEQIKAEKKSGKLCQNCQGKGYQGLVGVCEVMEINSTLKKLILQKASPETIYAVNKQSEISSLLDKALKFAQEGDTTLEEIARMMPDLIKMRNQPIVSNLNSPNSFDIQTFRDQEVPPRDRIAQLENLAQVTQNNVDLGLQLLQEQILAMQEQLTAIAQTKIQQKLEQTQTPKKVYALPLDPWG
ncbi:MAG: GspE/PulE family protein [Microcystaceae cyanobacterium]